MCPQIHKKIKDYTVNCIIMCPQILYNKIKDYTVIYNYYACLDKYINIIKDYICVNYNKIKKWT